MDNSIILVAFKSVPFLRPRLIDLCYVYDQENYDILLSYALKDKNPKVRYKAIQSILKHSYFEAIELVARALQDPDDIVSLAAIECLVHLGSPRSIDFVFENINKLKIPNQLEAVRALKDFPKEKYRDEIQQRVMAWNANGKLVALNTLLAIGCSEDFAQKLLDLALDERYPKNIQKLAFANIRKAKHLPISLIKRIEQAGKEDDSMEVHLELVRILATYPPGKEMQIALLQFLHHISIDVHRVVVQALGEKGTREAIYHLGEVITEGKKPDQLMNKYDARMAELAIQKIASRHPLPSQTE